MPFDLQLTDEQQALKEMLHSFATDVLRPQGRAAESAGRASDDILKQVHELGVAAPVPEEYGGGGTFDAVTYCIAAEELAWGDPGIAQHVLGSGLPVFLLAAAGTDDQKALLRRFADVEPHSSFVALGEKVATGDIESLDTIVDEDKVTGEKYAVVDPGAASFGIVIGRSPEGDASAAVVEPEAWEIIRPETKLGLAAAPTAVVRFDGPADRLLTGPGLTQGLLWAKLMTAAIAVGCARASLEYASTYATEREAFGKPIGAFQAISFKIADMAIEVDAARVTLWRAAWKLDRGEATLADVAEAAGQALGTAVLCGDDGVQVLGGHGYIQDHPVEKWFRDAVTLSAFDSPDLAGDVMVARSVFV